jgi:hypothetical protein
LGEHVGVPLREAAAEPVYGLLEAAAAAVAG